jgi:hypothetical protein
MDLKERVVENRLTELANKHKFIAWKWSSTRRGVPDRIVIHNGKVYPVELKSPKGKLTPQQVHVHNLILAQNVQVYTLTSVADVNEFVNRMLSDAL